jgi:polyisoprenoid-binding protein YceI
MLSTETSYYKTSHGKISFESNATLEKIIGNSNDLRAVVDLNTGAFSIAVDLESFHGFNSQLQKEHYAENYVETQEYPDATFSGKIIEEIDLNKQGISKVRAKGNFTLHGIRINKIIPASLTVVNVNQLKIEASFQLNLTDFHIKVPRMVHKKVAENIEIKVNLLLNKS